MLDRGHEAHDAPVKTLTPYFWREIHGNPTKEGQNVFHTPVHGQHYYAIAVISTGKVAYRVPCRTHPLSLLSSELNSRALYSC
jgi:hypothetical protein